MGIGATDTYKTLSGSGLFEDFSSDPLAENIQPAYVQMLKDLTGSSELNGLPFSSNASGVIYNKAMFTEAALPCQPLGMSSLPSLKSSRTAVKMLLPDP